MAATMKKAAAEDVNVTFEDQQKINKFARNTSRITELKEEIEVKKKNLQEEIDALESRVESIQRVLADLKVQLYAKFGSNINLEADES
ncbi:prefoldin subunit 4 [Orycteropus afer afer]|uniref:Prefoldin subunit 4 n=1 Tax=Orycteropus afer afer TaxID=1230840 RepID=A0A8B6ZRR7_ORYAF|nr:prefoldin subunit 4 [Orycteropus afer afer]